MCGLHAIQGFGVLRGMLVCSDSLVHVGGVTSFVDSWCSHKPVRREGGNKLSFIIACN